MQEHFYIYIISWKKYIFFKKYTRITTTTASAEKKSMFGGKTTGKGRMHMAGGKWVKKKAQCYYYFYMEYKCILIHRSQSEYEKI